MRPVQLGQPVNDNDARWIQESLREIERSSQDETEAAFDDYTLSNVTETRTLDVSAATLTDLKNFVATMVLDIQRRGRRNLV